MAWMLRAAPAILVVCAGCVSLPFNFGAPAAGHKHPKDQPLNLAPLPPIEEKVVKQAGHNDTEHFFDQVSFLQQQLMEADDRNKVLARRLEEAENKLQEREKYVARCEEENRKAFQEIDLALRDLQRWRSEAGRLKGRINGLEKDNREVMETMVRTLEQILERDKSHHAPPPPPVPMPPKYDD